MNQVELYPSEEACIETTARRRYRDLTQAVLRGEEPGDDAMREIDLLQKFLERADFPKLRADSEAVLREGKHVTFRVSRTDGKVTCRMEVV